MNKSFLWQLAVFAIVLVLLNFFFQLHISVISSLLLTIVLSLVFNFIQNRR